MGQGTMAERIDVFISSTSRDLKKYRDKVKDTVLNAGAFPIAMEEFDASEHNALQKCYDELCQAEIFIGIYAHRYGFAPGSDMMYITEDNEARAGDGVTSITEWEYQWAREHGLPMLLYLIADTDDEGEPLAWVPSFIDLDPMRSQLNAFKQNLAGSHVVGFFHSTDDLARQIAGALPKLLARFDALERIPLPMGRADFYRHINLPANFLPRPALLVDIREALFRSRPSDNGIALHGMGGIGKSVMARALCDDSEVQTQFPDGILWVSIGQDAREDDLRAKMRSWVETLGGVLPEAVPSLDRLKETLALLLSSRTCLLVIDDVWRRRDADIFRVGGDHCSLLVTTRDSEVAHALGVELQPIPLMTPSEAINLLDEWSSGALTGISLLLKRRIVDTTLGRLPLAIRLAGAQLRSRSPEAWLAAFDSRRLAARRPETIHDSLTLTFGLSLDALGAVERQLYAALSIFKEDEAIPEAVICLLWETLDQRDVLASTDLIDDLAARALLEVTESVPARGIVLHDLLRDFVSNEVTDPIHLHHALLNAYRRKLPISQQAQSGGWHHLPDDGYLYNHLVYHLLRADDEMSLLGLFGDDRWLNARVTAGGYLYDGYVADLETVWFEIAEPAAQAQVEANAESFSAFPMVARLALIRTSINSLASNHIQELVARAVEINLLDWTPVRALSIARHLPNALSRASFYARLIQTGRFSVEETMIVSESALAAVRLLEEPADQIEAFARVLPIFSLGDRPALIEEALGKVAQMPEAQVRIHAIAQLAPFLNPEQRSALTIKALDEAVALKLDKPRTAALMILAPHVPTEGHARILSAADAFDNERFAADVIEALAPFLDDSLLIRAFEIAKGIHFQGFRVRAVAALVLRLSPNDPTRAGWVEFAYQDADTDMEWWVGVSALAMLSQIVESVRRTEVLERAFEITLIITSPRSKMRALAALAKALRSSDIYWNSLCLAEAKRLQVDEETYAEFLTALAGKLTPSDLAYVLSVSSGFFEAAYARTTVLSAYAPYLERDTLAQILSLTYTIHDERAQIEAVASLARALPVDERESALSQAFAVLETIRDERTRAKALIPLVPALPETLIRRVISLLQELTDIHLQVRVIDAMVGHIPEDLIPQVLEIVRHMSDQSVRIEMLSYFMGYLPPDERTHLEMQIAADPERYSRSSVDLYLSAARLAQSEEERDDLIRQALVKAQQVRSMLPRMWSISAIARRHSSPAITSAVNAIFEQTLQVRYEWSRASALAALSGALSAEQRERAVATAYALTNPWSKIWALAPFANMPNASPLLIADFRKVLLAYLRNRTELKRGSKLQFLTPRAVYRAPTFDHATVEEIARVVIDVCWRWRWL